MSAEEFITTTIRLPFSTIKALIRQCERDYMLPRHVVARSVGESDRNLGDLALLKIPYQDRRDSQSYGDLSAIQKRQPIGLKRKRQTRIYLSILSQIAKARPERFAEVAPTLNGTTRTYFARTRKEVESTGRSNEASHIPETEWFASVNNSGDRKQKTLVDLMRGVGGFSEDYIDLISRAPCEKFPALSGIELKALKSQ